MSRWPSETAFLLREENIRIEHKGKSSSHLCWIYLDLADRDALVFEPQDSVEALTVNPSDSESFLLHIAGAADPIECHVVAGTMSFGADGFGCYIQLSPRYSGFTIKWNDRVSRIESGVINFVQCWFSGRGANVRFDLAFESWTFSFVPIDTKTLSYPRGLGTEKFSFTHHLTVTSSKTPFSSKEAGRRLYELNMFMSFCKGAWVSTALTSGFNDDGVLAMEEWGTHLLSPSKEPDSWMDTRHGESMVELFPLFIAKIQDPEWEDAIRIALYWYVRADTNNVGPDGGCLFLQAALERFSWHVLVRHRRAISEDGFTRLPAADQLRLLLSTLNIPAGIPENCKQIHGLAKGLSWRDAPQALIEIRNHLVHPPKLSKKTPKYPYYEAYVTSKRFLELAILSACGYTGLYADRTKWPRSRGDVEKVPWANGGQKSSAAE